MHVVAEEWNDETCLGWLWQERFSADGAHAMCGECGRERRFHRLRDRRAFACDTCGNQIYPTSGTIFERSRTPLIAWFHAVRLMLGANPPEPTDLSGALRVSPTVARRMRTRILDTMAEGGEQAHLLSRLQSALAAGVSLEAGQLPPATPSSREPTIDVIRAAACRAFAENGVDGTRIIDIADEAGVSTGIIHYYFRHKDEVLLAALRWANEQITQTLRALPAGVGDIARMATMLELSVPSEGLLRDEMLLWLEVWVRARQQPTLVSESYAISQTWHREMTDAIQRGVDVESFRPAATPEEVAHRLIAVANGLGFKAAVGYGGVGAREVRRLLLRFAAEQLNVPFASLQQASKAARRDGAGASRSGPADSSPRSQAALSRPRV
jgi:AcrR family transcriptional regulator